MLIKRKLQCGLNIVKIVTNIASSIFNEGTMALLNKACYKNKRKCEHISIGCFGRRLALE